MKRWQEEVRAKTSCEEQDTRPPEKNSVPHHVALHCSPHYVLLIRVSVREYVHSENINECVFNLLLTNFANVFVRC